MEVEKVSDARPPFGQFLSELRVRYGFKTQKQLAEAAGISQATLSRIEAGTQKPNPETLMALAQQLRPVTYGELMEKAGYLQEDHRIQWTEASFIDSEEELDETLQTVIQDLSISGHFLGDVPESLKLELGPLINSESRDPINYTVEDLQQLLQELRGNIEYKTRILESLIRVRKLSSAALFRDPEFTTDTRAVARHYQELAPADQEIFKAILKTMRERAREARKET